MPLRKEILELNRQRSEAFCTPQARDRLALFSSRHPTKILVFKCMDGRINLPLITGVPLGKLHPFRNIGGKFTLGDPYLGRLILDAKDAAVRSGRATLALCTYHFSAGSTHRGCAGHGYDTQAARRGALNLVQEFEDVFGKGNDAIAAITIGIETDEDALIFCNHKGKKFVVAEHTHSTDEEIHQALKVLYPHLSARMLNDILPLALGNRDHVAQVRSQERPVTELEHNENIICVGRGFDWLHLPNRALIIGPYGYTDSTWREAIGVAGNIVRNNFKHNKQLREAGALLLVSAPYEDMGEYRLAIAKAKFFATIAQNVLEPVSTQLKLVPLVGVTDMTTMLFHPLEKAPRK